MELLLGTFVDPSHTGFIRVPEIKGVNRRGDGNMERKRSNETIMFFSS